VYFRAPFHSQLSAAKRTSTGSAFSALRVQRYNFFQNFNTFFRKKLYLCTRFGVAGVVHAGKKRESGENPEQCPLL